MKSCLNFRINETDYHLKDIDSEQVVLDYLRNNLGLKGTKEGCREGDCGACLVLLGGNCPNNKVEWKAVTSCTLPLAELNGKSLITIEGIAKNGLTPVMQAILDEGASQCGFCSPGFVLALTGFLISGAKIDPIEAMIAVEGNLCRCTGYGSIRRAAQRLATEFKDLPESLEERLKILSAKKVIPESLASLMTVFPKPAENTQNIDNATIIGGGTDYFVRNRANKLDNVFFTTLANSKDNHEIKIINRNGQDFVSIGKAVTAHEFFVSEIVNQAVPGIKSFETRFASPLIRTRATLAGNMANASPIGDLSVIMLALKAELELSHIDENGKTRSEIVKASDFFVSYKKTLLKKGSLIEKIQFPAIWTDFTFQKVAKRRLLDIATVNMAIALQKDSQGKAKLVSMSVGGVAEIPLIVEKAEKLLAGNKPNTKMVIELGKILSETGSPMSDVRGSSKYRKNLLERMTWAAIIKLWPELKLEEELLK